MSVIEEIFNILAPHECLACGIEGDLLCKECSSRLIKTPERCYKCGRWSEDFRTCDKCRKKTQLSVVWTATKYEAAAKDLISAIKFSRARAGAVAVAELLAAARPNVGDVIITHIPTAERRVRERGYDQAALIAKALAKRLNQPYSPLLVRLGNKRQLGQKREVRKKQMEGAFRPVRLSLIEGRHVIVVDDVLTTGATCEEAAKILRQAGAKQVSAAVFAVV